MAHKIKMRWEIQSEKALGDGGANKWTNKMEIMQIVDDVESEDDGHGSAMAVWMYLRMLWKWCCDVLTKQCDFITFILSSDNLNVEQRKIAKIIAHSTSS